MNDDCETPMNQEERPDFDDELREERRMAREADRDDFEYRASSDYASGSPTANPKDGFPVDDAPHGKFRNNKFRNNKFRNNKFRNKSRVAGDEMNSSAAPAENPQEETSAENPVHDPTAPSLNISELQEKSMQELTQMGTELGIEGIGALEKSMLICEILRANAEKNGQMYGSGYLEVLPDGFGFLRSPSYSYLPCSEDIYLSPSQIKRFALKTGDFVTGQIRAPREKERFFAMLKVENINHDSPERKKNIIPFNFIFINRI